ncbi:MAG TPA: patatin-like phospholipase family protein [Nocardioides sp.]|uniref:patatin-like phospholipase family protein n=1 Tax=Nocardioides sp. TaxID=35761 RepID=UPI002E3047BF|nr:patatin-like phospholipase family protein [Nocardioides sp.]HEX5086709.1 patatin-like phospholipase family protein [Nocardioides sp.]
MRGVVALEVLARIEQVLRDETGDPTLVLGDWFDYVGGTSTGAIIAGGVAIGLPVSRIQELYRENMRSIFTRAGLFDLVRARYDEAGIETVLRRELGEERTLGAADLRCL